MLCLVTGGAGFIGSHLVEALLQAGHSVRVLDDFSTGKGDNLRDVRDQIHFFPGSILGMDAVRAAVNGVQWVFHFAALPSVQRSLEDPEASHAVCATGTLQLLRAAVEAGVRRVIYAASSSAYGGCTGSIRTEQDHLCPLSPYAAAKLAGEGYCQAFTASYGLETVRLRFFNIFGPRQDSKNPYSGVIALFLGMMSEGRSPVVHGDGLQSRDFTYVANAVQAAIRAAESPVAPGQVYNIGAGQSTTVLALVEHLNQLLGVQLRPIHASARLGDVRHSQADVTKARAELGYEPSVSFREGLERTVWHFRNESR